MSDSVGRYHIKRDGPPCESFDENLHDGLNGGKSMRIFRNLGCSSVMDCKIHHEMIE